MGGRGSGGNRNSGSEMTEAQWEENNTRVEQDFADWLDSNNKGHFQAGQYAIFEKMTLAEAQKWLKPNSASGFSYNDSDEVPEDTWYYIVYNDGSYRSLEPGDDLKGVKRSGLTLVVQENDNTTIIYSKNGSSGIQLYNDAKYEEKNDLWRWDSNYLR